MERVISRVGKVCGWRVRTRCFIKYGSSRAVHRYTKLLARVFVRIYVHTSVHTYARVCMRMREGSESSEVET